MSNVHKIRSNILMQDVYIRENSLAACRTVDTARSPVEYDSLDRVPCEKSPLGFEDKITKQSYPITPEYVASFSNSADYHSDVSAAMTASASSAGKNLGDVRAMQDVNSMDSSQLSELLTSVERRLNELRGVGRSAADVENNTVEVPTDESKL